MSILIIIMINEGEMAPDFILPNQDGTQISLAAYRGRTVILYFYPKDDTPGCTKEACSLRDGQPQLSAKGAVVVGVSPDSPASHLKFRKKYGIDFDLLSDTSHAVLEAYGAWGEKNLYGKKSLGVLRSTFLIAGDGVIKKIIRKVDTADHANQLIPYLG